MIIDFSDRGSGKKFFKGSVYFSKGVKEGEKGYIKPFGSIDDKFSHINKSGKRTLGYYNYSLDNYFTQRSTQSSYGTNDVSLSSDAKIAMIYDSVVKVQMELSSYEDPYLDEETITKLQNELDSASESLLQHEEYSNTKEYQVSKSIIDQASLDLENLGIEEEAPTSIDEVALLQELENGISAIEQIESDLQSVIPTTESTEVVINEDVLGTTNSTGDQQDSSIAVLENGNYVLTYTDGKDVYAQLHDSNGNKVGGEVQVNTTTKRDHHNSNVTALEGGGYVITWEGQIDGGDKNEIFAQMYDENGNTVGSEILVNTATHDDQKNSSVTALDDGGFVVTYQTNEGKEINMQRFDADGVTVGGETQVSTTSDNNKNASITTLSDGGYVVTWQGEVDGGDKNEILAQRYDSDGNTVGSEILVNTLTQRDQKNSSVTALADGGFVVSYQTDEGKDIKLQQFDSSGNKVGSEITVNTTSENEQKNATITALNDGGYVVAWEGKADDALSVNGTEIYAQAYDSSGNTVGSEIQLNGMTAFNQNEVDIAATSNGFIISYTSDMLDGNKQEILTKEVSFENLEASEDLVILEENLVNSTTSGNQEESDIAVLENGNYVVTFTDGKDVYAQLHDSNGNKVGGEVQVNTTTKGDHNNSNVTALEGGGYVITWEGQIDGGDKNEIFAQMYDENGNTVGSEILVNTATHDDQKNSSVTALDNGGFVVTYQTNEGKEINMQRFDADGVTVGGETQVSATSDNNKNASITTLSDGGYVVTWQGEVDGGNKNEILAQRYDSDGNAVGSEILVNTSTQGDQKNSSVTALADGGFVVSYQTNEGKDIKLQQFDSSGNKVGSEVTVNTTSDAEQKNVDITALKSGGYVVTWEGEANDAIGSTGTEIFGQVYDSAGNTVDSEFRVNSLKAYNQSQVSVASTDKGFIVSYTSDKYDGDGTGIYTKEFVLEDPETNTQTDEDFFEGRSVLSELSALTELYNNASTSSTLQGDAQEIYDRLTNLIYELNDIDNIEELDVEGFKSKIQELIDSITPYISTYQPNQEGKNQVVDITNKLQVALNLLKTEKKSNPSGLYHLGSAPRKESSSFLSKGKDVIKKSIYKFLREQDGKNKLAKFNLSEGGKVSIDQSKLNQNIIQLNFEKGKKSSDSREIEKKQYTYSFKNIAPGKLRSPNLMKQNENKVSQAGKQPVEGEKRLDYS